MAAKTLRSKSRPPDPSRVRLEVDLQSIRRNFAQIRKSVKPAQVMTVLKANAYGLGAIPVAEALLEAGTDRFGVAELKEASQLVKRFRRPVQIIGGVLASEVPECVRLGVVCPVSDLAMAKIVSREARKQGKQAKIHIKVDTGMGRLGIPYFQAFREIREIRKLSGLVLEGIYSHFPNANNPMHGKTREQLDLFRSLLGELEGVGIGFPLVHMANSDGINNFPESYFNMVRTGINLYGVFDLSGLRSYKLSPSLTLKTSLIAKRRLPAGYTIGYGCTHTLFRDTWVGTVPAGYADGVPLAASNSGQVLIRGKACNIIGRVSMDYLTVDLNGCPASKVGDPVILVGKSGKKEITIEDWARIKQTHPYEIICSLGNRVERAYR
ncbi:MAG: Alanine racemase [Fibrobacteres bacterium]|nr:Alanine racemase [Fibrobacterota bacterium]